MVNTGMKHAVAAGGMEDAWKIWKCRPMIERTWANWKDHWTAAFQEKRELIKLTGTAYNGMANQAREAEEAGGDQLLCALVPGVLGGRRIQLVFVILSPDPRRWYKG